MNAIFNDIISLKAKTKSVKEYEIYREYIEKHKLVKLIHKDKKLARLMKPRKIKIEKENKDLLL